MRLSAVMVTDLAASISRELAFAQLDLANYEETSISRHKIENFGNLL